MIMSPDVIVIGGGVAGLSASVKLIKSGANVLLIEKNNHLGGRTYSFCDKRTKTIVDNGQHLLIGAYKNTYKYLELIGTQNLLSINDRNGFVFLEDGFKSTKFVIPDIPGPLKLIAALLKMKQLSLKDKLGIIKLGAAIKNWDGNFQKSIMKRTVEEWLDNNDQDYRAKKYLWHPLTISIMNESPQLASAILFAKVLKDVYFQESDNSRIWIPTVGQSELYVKEAIRLFESNKSRVLLNKKVRRIIHKDGSYVGVDTGDVIRSKYAICAVPHFNFWDILRDSDFNDGYYKQIKYFQSSPIVSVNLWFDHEVMENEFVGLIGTTVQWVFNKNKIFHSKNDNLFYITAIISNARGVIDLNKEKITGMVLSDLQKTIPEVRKANVLYSSVIKERHATFSAVPEVEQYRPDQKSIIKNLYLAGDWTNTGLPATIEGAIYSGFLCAEMIIKGD